ncbi:MAG TPA: hypothetical protein VMJ10_26905 [Kofleriaceae bacterium]|nr:hypothetical protein [Kofleriaceae bacterium]
MFAVFALAACGHAAADRPDSASGAPDASDTGSDAASMPDAGLDMSPGVACFYDWATLGTCPAPAIDAAYLTTDCLGTTGVFVVGHGFESANQFMVGNGWMPYGPAAANTVKLDNFWNELTPTFMCITTSADPGYWSGFALQLKNPDGQLSNTVTVQNLLTARPQLASTGSDDPFDPDACLDTGMSAGVALSTFPVGASTSTVTRVTIVSHTRSCNAATGCLAWSAPTMVAANVSIGLSITDGGSTIDTMLGDTDCGVLGANDETITRNFCAMPSQMYSMHVADHCAQVWATERTTVANDGSYMQTDYGAIGRY